MTKAQRYVIIAETAGVAWRVRDIYGPFNTQQQAYDWVSEHRDTLRLDAFLVHIITAPRAALEKKKHGKDIRS